MAAMDEAKKRGFATFAGSGTLAGTSLRCTQHTECFKGDGAMLRVVSATQGKARQRPCDVQVLLCFASLLQRRMLRRPPYLCTVWSVYEQRAACWR